MQSVCVRFFFTDELIASYQAPRLETLVSTVGNVPSSVISRDQCEFPSLLYHKILCKHTSGCDLQSCVAYAFAKARWIGITISSNPFFRQNSTYDCTPQARPCLLFDIHIYIARWVEDILKHQHRYLGLVHLSMPASLPIYFAIRSLRKMALLLTHYFWQ